MDLLKREARGGEEGGGDPRNPSPQQEEGGEHTSSTPQKKTSTRLIPMMEGRGKGKGGAARGGE